jgi:hypothetical protein
MRLVLISISAISISAIFLAGCGPVKIGRINADPSRFRNQTVHVDGTVVNSVGVLGTGGYQIDDGTGKIYVLSRRGVPSRGSHVAVSGRVSQGVEVLGQPVGVAIREESHKVR